MNHDITAIARLFSHHRIISVAELGNGNINDTYLVTDTKRPFILQRLNPAVFANPTLIFENQLKLQKLVQTQPSQNKQLHIPRLLLTTEGRSHYQDMQGHYWRGQEFIENGQEIPHLSSNQAESVGLLLGSFHRLGQSQPSLTFHDILPGLHATSKHLQNYQNVKTNPVAGSTGQDLSFCHDYIEEHQQYAMGVDRKLNKTMPKRLIHGDPKLANILFDKTSKRACTLIDLDTIGPGLIHHDLSDLIRSCCNRAGEEQGQQEVHFDFESAQRIITGYSNQTASFLTREEVNLLGESLWLIPFELGVRFLCDYLNGSTYFKASSPRQNLTRAAIQLKLSTQIRQLLPELQNHINGCFK